MKTAVDLAKELNASAQKWMDEAPEGDFRWAGLLAEDAEHWAEYGIYTADELGAYLDQCVEDATTDADRDYFDNVEESQEWRDFDPAC